MRFHHILFCAALGLVSAGASLADEATELGDEVELRFAEQLDQQLDIQLSALVAQELAQEVEALRVPSAVPPTRPRQRSTPVASATSARALPGGQLTETRLSCEVGMSSVLDCTVDADATRAPAAITSLAVKTP